MTFSHKNSKTYNLYDICIVISAVAMVGILIAIPYQISSVMSLGTYIIAICAAIMYGKHIAENLHQMPYQGIILILLIIVCFFAVLISHENLKNDIVSAICFLEIPIFMLCGKQILSKRSTEVFLWLQYILSFYYLFLSTTNMAHYFEGPYGVTVIDELTLAYHNPNEASMYLTACFLTLLVAITTYKKLMFKILFGINAILIFALVWQTGSRAGILVCIMAIACIIFAKKIPVKRYMTRIALATPLIMIILILLFNDKMVEWQILGSSVDTGRIHIFNRVFNNLEFHEFLLGDFATHNFNNLHNIYISIFGTIGIFGVVLYAIYMNNMLTPHQQGRYSLVQKMAYLGALLLIIYSSVESAIFTGGSAFAMCFIGLYLSSTFNKTT